VSLEQAFLRDVNERPHDDTPRLVYADWLDDNGRPERAEFIRVQCRLAELPTGHPERPALKKRERALRKKNGKEWRQPLPPPYRSGPFFRGFVTPRLCIHASPWVTEHFLTPEFLPPDCAPLWEAWVAGYWAPEGVDLVSHPALDRLIGVWVKALPEDLLGRLVTSPRSRHLTTLSATLIGFGPGAAGAIGESPHLGRLTSLHLSCNPLGPAGGRALAAAPHLRRLRDLDLSAAQLGDEGVLALAGSPVLDTVVRLHLTNNGLTDRAADALLESPHLANVRHRILWSAAFSDGRWKALQKRFGKRLVPGAAGPTPEAPNA
jgi:uncharacterized protein (TIGR02996 family)